MNKTDSKTPEQLLMDKIVLRAQLDSLYADIEKAKKDLAQYQDLSKQVEALMKENAAGEEQLKVFTRDIEEKRNALEKLNDDFARNKAVNEEKLAEDLKLLEKGASTKSSMDGEIKLLEEKIGRLNTKLAEDEKVAKQKLADLGEAMDKTEKELESLDKEKERLSPFVSGLEASVKVFEQKIRLLNQEQSLLQTVCDNLSREKIELEKKVAELDGAVKSFEEDQVKGKKDLEALTAAKNESLDKRESELSEREADLSIQQKWMEGQIIKLRKYKDALEKFYGKRFNDLTL